MVPTVGGFGSQQLLSVRQRAVTLGGVLRRVTQCDVCFAGNHCRLFAGLCLGNGRINCFGVVAVDFQHIPAGGQETLFLVRHVRNLDLAVDGDAVVIPQYDQVRQLQLAGKADGLLANALHQATVARDHVGIVINDLFGVARALDFFGDCHANGRGDALTQGAGCGFDTGGVAIFGVARGDRAQLAEVLDLLQCHLGVAREVQQRIKQHRAVACRQDKPVPVGPCRIGGIKLHVTLKQNRGDVGHAHGHPGVPRVGGSHRIKGQRANGGCAAPVAGVCGAQGVEVHEASFLKGMGCLRA